MSAGAFRDAGAALERVAVLEQEKDDLEPEVRRLREVSTNAPRRSFLATLFGKR